MCFIFVWFGCHRYDLLQVCVEGPKEKLDTTAVSQPAIFVASMCAVEKLRATEGDAAADEATVCLPKLGNLFIFCVCVI